MKPSPQPNDRATHEILRNLPYGLYVVGVQNATGDEANALVVSWLTQCSFDPPLLLIALRQDSLSLAMLKESQAFSVNLIDVANLELVRHYVKPAHGAGNKLHAIDYSIEAAGTLVLKQAMAFIECKAQQIFQPGDHAIIIGQVLHVGRRRDGQILMTEDLGWHYGG